MMASAGLNVVLDPLFIFGIGWFPALGLVGAAVATVTSRVITLIGAILILHYRHRMLSWVRPRLRDIAQSWRQLLYIAIPTSATNVLFPLSLGVFTRLVAGYGKEAVAGVGAAGRVESFAMMVLWALASTLIPFVGQNWGARNLERVRRVQRFSYAFSLGWGLFCWIMFLFFARPIAGLFSAEPGVIKTIVLYLSIIPFGFGMRGVSMYTSISFNAINKPLCAAAINIIRLVVFYIPMAWLGGHFFGLLGIFGGIALSYICAGFAALWWERKVCPLDRHFNEMAAADEIEAELSAP
jgi:Na+-driven multidrug efflux pump